MLPRPVWENSRVHLLNDIWLLSIVAVLLATGIPWFSSGFEIDVGIASWGLLGLGGIHIAFTLLASSSRPPGPWHDRTITSLHLVAIMVIGFIWQHVGALQNPMFLAIFALPVIGSIFLPRRRPYLTAMVSVAVIAVVALRQTPELRWFVNGLIGGHSWLNALLGSQGAVTQPSFSGFYAPSSYLLVVLEVFAIVLLACAVAAEHAGIIFERLNADSAMARAEAQRGQELWSTLLEQLPPPTLLIDPLTLRVVAASQSAKTYLQYADRPLEGRTVSEALPLSYPDIVQGLVAGAGGEAPGTVIRVADQLRMKRVRVLHVAHRKRRLALLTIDDVTENFCLRAALDTSEYAALVVDSRGRIAALNRSAAGLFGGVEVGAQAAQLLPQQGPASSWWDPGLPERRKMHVEIGARIYQVTCAAVTVPGEEQRIYTVSLLPIAKADGTDALAAAAATGSTSITRIQGQLR
jgi:PAS domain-containing protein